MFKIFVKVDKH